ncbi:GIY-YIG nuclease family protein [Patescibacteria group bacterium]|nr:GIY-YIG nuclease family protein [Patescibacteria group bacterium]MBU1970506.1 GIY-YIG nuclease family protein [Patescibacteria group bacterium]
MYFVYVIRNKNGLLYKGSTENLEKRLAEHNRNGKTWTNIRRPWEVVYKECYNSRSDAVKRECFFKTGKGREFLKTELLKK